MAEQKKGHVKLTVEVEINEALMEIVKESMKNMPQMMQKMARARVFSSSSHSRQNNRNMNGVVFR